MTPIRRPRGGDLYKGEFVYYYCVVGTGARFTQWGEGGGPVSLVHLLSRLGSSPIHCLSPPCLCFLCVGDKCT